jgi:hypothetical protein
MAYRETEIPDIKSPDIESKVREVLFFLRVYLKINLLIHK